jgi:hypothetical protein
MCDGVDQEAAAGSLTNPQQLLLSALEEESNSPHHRLIIAYGTAFEPARLPAGVSRGRDPFELARAEPESYAYYEGFATRSTGPRWPIQRRSPIPHAWCVDRLGRVVDRTWVAVTPLAYRGVPLSLDVIGDLIVEESAGFLHTRGTFAMFADDADTMAQFLGLRER